MLWRYCFGWGGLAPITPAATSPGHAADHVRVSDQSHDGKALGKLLGLAVELIEYQCCLLQRIRPVLINRALGSGAFDVRYAPDGGAKADIAERPSCASRFLIFCRMTGSGPTSNRFNSVLEGIRSVPRG